MVFSTDNVIAYFQPILCAASNTIYSYEVLGRYIDQNGNVNSLGAFFSDNNTTHEDALRVDRIVRRKAMEKYVQEKRTEFLFVNIRLAWLKSFIGKPDALPTIQWARELDIDLGKIVIEITEEEFAVDDVQQAAAHLDILSYYKNAGCRIALDDYGKKASNIDRIAFLQPDIIKINMDYIHKSEPSYHYREYLVSLAAFAEAVGIEVLYEGIETQRQLEICMTSGGRLYQGYMFAYPQPSMDNAVVNYNVFSVVANDVCHKQYQKFIYSYSLKNYLDSKIGFFLLEHPSFYVQEDVNASLSKLCHELPDLLRIYLCNKHGEQITCNFEWNSENIEQNDGYLGNNWAWRGFFQEAIKVCIAGRKSGLSTIYRDFTTKERIFTYFYALTTDIYLFVDMNDVPLMSQAHSAVSTQQ